MAFTHGRLTYVKINSVDLSAWIDNSNWDIEADTHETTTYGKSTKTYISGLIDGKASIGGIYDAAAGGPDIVLRPLVGGAAVTFEYGPEGSAAGKRKISGSLLVKSFKPSNPVGDVVRWTADLQMTDTQTAAVFP